MLLLRAEGVAVESERDARNGRGRGGVPSAWPHIHMVRVIMDYQRDRSVSCSVSPVAVAPHIQGARAQPHRREVGKDAGQCRTTSYNYAATRRHLALEGVCTLGAVVWETHTKRQRPLRCAEGIGVLRGEVLCTASITVSSTASSIARAPCAVCSGLHRTPSLPNAHADVCV